MDVIGKVLAALLLTNVASYQEQNVRASWYDCVKASQCSKHKITASGEKFNPNDLTAAHKTLPFGTRVLIFYKDKYVLVRINDRGPHVRGRSLDLSRRAAQTIGCEGVCRVKIYILRLDKKKKA